jgi:hypothetical protein
MPDSQLSPTGSSEDRSSEAARMAQVLGSVYIGGAGDPARDDDVKEAVRQRIRAQKKAERKAGALNMVMGMLLFLLGLGISAASLWHFFEAGGGWVVVTYGLVLVGGTQFVIGLSQLIRWHIGRPRKHYVSSAVMERSGLAERPAPTARPALEDPVLKAIPVDEETPGASPAPGAGAVLLHVPGPPVEYAMSWRGTFYFKYVTPLLLMGTFVGCTVILLKESPMDPMLLAVVLVGAVLFSLLSILFVNLRHPVTLVGGILRIGRDAEAYTVLLSEIVWIRVFNFDRAFFVLAKSRGPTPAGRWLAFVLPFKRRHELRDGQHPLVLLLRQRTTEFGGRGS